MKKSTSGNTAEGLQMALLKNYARHGMNDQPIALPL
jgi:hypothetical protein